MSSLKYDLLKHDLNIEAFIHDQEIVKDEDAFELLTNALFGTDLDIKLDMDLLKKYNPYNISEQEEEIHKSETLLKVISHALNTGINTNTYPACKWLNSG